MKVLVTLKEEQASLIEQHQTRLAAQQEERSRELQQLRELHRRDLEDARKQHSDMLEHLNRARALESDAFKEASSYSRYGICFYSHLVFVRVIHLMAKSSPAVPHIPLASILTYLSCIVLLSLHIFILFSFLFYLTASLLVHKEFL
jgi:hypothetical protein